MKSSTFRILVSLVLLSLVFLSYYSISSTIINEDQLYHKFTVQGDKEDREEEKREAIERRAHNTTGAIITLLILAIVLAIVFMILLIREAYIWFQSRYQRHQEQKHVTTTSERFQSQLGMNHPH